MMNYQLSRMKPLHRFRLYAESKSRLYVRVNVWPTLRAMRAYGRESYFSFGRDCHGAATQLHLYRNRRCQPLFCEVNLVRRHLGTELITHELFHAAIAWGRRVGFDFSRLNAPDSVNADEERITYVHGRLCRQFVDRAWKAGLYK